MLLKFFGSDGKVSAYHAGDSGSIPGSEKISWRRKRQPTPIFLPEKISWTEEPGRLIGSWGRKESDTTEGLHFLSLFIFKFCPFNYNVFWCGSLLSQLV